MDQQTHPPDTAPVTPSAAPRFANTPRPTGPAPAPAASLHRRIDGRRAAAPRPIGRQVAGVIDHACPPA